MYSTVKIKYRLIIVKATKLLAKTGIFLYICMYLPIQAQERRWENLNSGLTAVCARCLRRTQHARTEWSWRNPPPPLPLYEILDSWILLHVVWSLRHHVTVIFPCLKTLMTYYRLTYGHPNGKAHPGACVQLHHQVHVNEHAKDGKER